MSQESKIILPITVPTKFAEYLYKEKSSSFLGQLFPVESAEDAKNIIFSLKKKFYDATHHCYAYLCSHGDTKYSDDGEPSGTAGIRIMNAINQAGLTNVLVVVIRYFGGTKLGVGPLGKAYHEAASGVLEACERRTKYPVKKVTVSFAFDLVNSVYKLFNEYEAKIVETTYTDNIHLKVYCKFESVEKIKEKLISLSAGQITVVEQNEILFI